MWPFAGDRVTRRWQVPEDGERKTIRAEGTACARAQRWKEVPFSREIGVRGSWSESRAERGWGKGYGKILEGFKVEHSMV